ncbi:nickel pincer cofactor biosynthesis protein LarB [Puniceicoccales bacterium CK1056]|uniref:Nickel pincer cofactor biosynthesis protein LarB n=1 Tax=Oceanipulchritudo coccoides TaxID=2706888 RepID=A0A6B2M6N9_9BACT|nr:nickel pincer cofactor biosynthesis protein LarB [Oceanipulchritudo coccoides]NDV63475.1 nickel pincer cofactor biosynthesis protein LarB [Oceanipulchritudo coccoides]
MSTVNTILQAVKDGQLDPAAAEEQLRGKLFHDLGHSRVDHDRLDRNGAAEVIFGQGKTVDQLRDIMNSLSQHGQDILVSRLTEEKAEPLVKEFPGSVYHETARILTLQHTKPELTKTFICIACAGTSDVPVAEEARITAEFYGNSVKPIYDAGVAGLHRILAETEVLRQARVVIAVAGMEGALPSVVAGLVKAPVIAVPTSVGYGASFGGATALLAMLNSCASGLSVVNIDNGFGAGYLASMINKIA